MDNAIKQLLADSKIQRASRLKNSGQKSVRFRPDARWHFGGVGGEANASVAVARSEAGGGKRQPSLGFYKILYKQSLL